MVLMKSLRSQQANVKFLLSNNNKRFRNVHKITYKVSTSDTKESVSLVDRGENGGIARNDVRVIEELHQHVDVQGIDNHQMRNIPIVIAGSVTKMQRGEVILILISTLILGKALTFTHPLKLNPTRTKLMIGNQDLW